MVNRDAQRVIESRLGREAVPERFLARNLPAKLTKDADNQAGREACKRFVDSLRHGLPYWLGLAGPTGAGKSTLAGQLLAELARRGALRTYLWATTPRALEELRRKDDGINAAYRQAQVLVLDDFGLESRAEWDEALLFELLCHRYDERLSLVLCGNESPFEVFARWREPYRAAALIDRLNEMGEVALLLGDSRRNPRGMKGTRA